MHGSEGGVVVAGLESDISKALAREIRAEDQKLAMIITAEAGVAQDGAAHVLELGLSRSVPQITKRFVVIVQHDCTHSSDPNFEIWDEPRVELHETNELGDIAYELWPPPMVEEVVLTLRRAIAISADIDTDKFDAFWEDEGLFKAQG